MIRLDSYLNCCFLPFIKCIFVVAITEAFSSLFAEKLISLQTHHRSGVLSRKLVWTKRALDLVNSRGDLATIDCHSD